MAKKPGILSRFATAGKVLVRGLSLSDFVMEITGGEARRDRSEKPYSEVAPVYACVRAKADALARMPHIVSTADDQVVETGPLVALAHRPNPKQTGRSFMRETSALLDLFGRVHWYLVRARGVGAVSEMYIRNPLEMHPRKDAAGAIIGWTYKPLGSLGEGTMLSLDEVHTVTDDDYEDPRNLLGISPRKAAGLAIAQYFKADLANEASLDNGVEPGGAFKTPNNLTQEQREGLREQLSERAGVRRRRLAMVLEGGLEWQQIAAVFNEMEFRELKAMSRVDICAAFGVPPAVVGYFEDSNRAHADAAEVTFWTGTNIPRAAWIAEEWDMAVTSAEESDRSLTARDARRLWRKRSAVPRERRSGGYRAARRAAGGAQRKYFTWFDASAVPAVRKAQLDLAESAKTWIDKGVPLNQTIDAFDLPFENVPWGDTWWKPMALMDVQEKPPEPEPTPKPSDDDATKAGVPNRERVIRELDEQTLASLHRLWENSWASLERTCRNRWLTLVRETERQTLTRLESVLPTMKDTGRGDEPTAVHLVHRDYDDKLEWGRSVQLKAYQRDVVAEILFDLADFNRGLLAGVGPILREAVRLGGEQALAEAADAQGKPRAEADEFRIADPNVQAAMRSREIKITETSKTLRRRLANELSAGIADGEPISKIAERIRQEFNLAAGRANTIARTEVGGAVEQARELGRQQAGTPRKSWLWSRRETGRPWHQECEVQTMAEPVEVGKDFTLPQTGAQTPHPRGPGLTAEDAANCGCTTLGRYPGDSIKAVIGRYASRGFLTYEQLAQRDAQPQHTEVA